MTSVKDPDADQHFSNKLEDIWNKLLVQPMREMVDTEMELCQAHKEFFKPIKDICSKKSKEDEAMFEMIQKYRKDIKQNQALCKETGDSIPAILSEIEEKDTQKEMIIQKINKLRQEQARKKESIISQNKANKDKLKNLSTVRQVFQDWLGLEIRKIHGEKLQFIFRGINSSDPDGVHTFILRLSEEGLYQVVSCDPPLERMAHLEKRLLETNNFSAFLANVRKEFVSLPKT
uniref:Kinetochore protein SPC25 n=1 Tax=Paramormyrops kingsleyae TaxID=1676925 RepID=A0A3B3R288_9TELE|nr:kinetochore protein Spc25 [Paramormyrops kingsleyae]XP_023672358.1 kinetochore protein Spc25 [Paramormyrops kingsleyae]